MEPETHVLSTLRERDGCEICLLPFHTRNIRRSKSPVDWRSSVRPDQPDLRQDFTRKARLRRAAQIFRVQNPLGRQRKRLHIVSHVIFMCVVTLHRGSLQHDPHRLRLLLALLQSIPRVSFIFNVDSALSVHHGAGGERWRGSYPALGRCLRTTARPAYLTDVVLWS